MGKALSSSSRKAGLAVLGFLVIFMVAALVFRDDLGLVAFVGLVLALLVQIFRVASFHARSETLKKLWGAIKDAFWGIG